MLALPDSPYIWSATKAGQGESSFNYVFSQELFPQSHLDSSAPDTPCFKVNTSYADPPNEQG